MCIIIEFCFSNLVFYCKFIIRYFSETLALDRIDNIQFFYL